MLTEVSIIIKTFDRCSCLGSLLASIVTLDLPCPVLIADDSQESYQATVLKKYGRWIEKYIVLPFDSGLSKGRNVLLENVRTKYFVLCDDDFIFDKRADLLFMQQNLEEGGLDILGGLYYNRPLLIADQERALLKNLLRGKVRTSWRMILWHIFQNQTLRHGLFKRLFEKEKPWTYYGRFEINDHILNLYPLPNSEYRPPYVLCDYIPNFFLARTEALREKNVYWNDEIRYYGEHLDFFLRAKRQGLVVGMSREVGVIHQPIHTSMYRRGRNDHAVLLRANDLRKVVKVIDHQGVFQE
ncbi:MAG: glycosyltransferase [Chloroflexi bacterium]|nr:glycosyltransferase [Chloroflexota bacterium]MCI0645753.1 glycosyltransferase [Chloroflexota bacterium]MCI0727680.1 glycosyltransferase [Chloroflexota bacterium]